MKRGKDDDKIMGPMFPRLHVNDTEKGGPRAPPRNKMALYEQLSVPSQRFNPGVLPLNPTKTVPPSSSSQGSGHERSMFLPLHLHPPTHQVERTHASYSVLNNSMAQLEQKKKLDEEDFRVPIFVQSNMVQNHSESNNGMDRERDLPLAQPSLGHLMKFQNAGEKGQKRTCMASLDSTQEDGTQSEASLKEIVADRKQSVKSASHPSVRERIDDLSVRSSMCSTHERRDDAETNFSRLQKTDVSLQQSRPVARLENTPHSNDVEEQRGFDDPTNEYENHEDNRGGLLQTGNMDKADDASETSMLDSISELDISPDDVVGIIGQKHFWKARRAIVNQQRAFAFQVFELHRLIKVQRLIAGSPNLLFEENAYLGSRSLKGIHSNKLPLDYNLKTPPSIVKNKDDLEKPDTENAVGKTSLSSVQNGSATSNYRPFSGNLPVTTKMNPPYFPQPSGHQWLVPMISPSEGLVYKPYPGPGAWGGHGSLESAPLMGDLTQAYGVPTSHYHYQGIGFPFFFHGCLPAYGMTAMNPAISGSVEQINCPGPSELSGGEANFFMQHHHSSSNMRGWRDRVVSNVMKDNELQGSTASSPTERQGNGAGHPGEGKNLLPLLSTPVVEKVSQPQDIDQPDIDQPAQVIKVVPHNARTATESAARIFRSIQEERRHY